MPYLEIVRVDEPQVMYCATFFLKKAGNVVPGGYFDTVEQAMRALVHVLESRDVKEWAHPVEAMTPGVVSYMASNPTLSWSRFNVPDHPSDQVSEAIAGMTAGTSVRRTEEYQAGNRT